MRQTIGTCAVVVCLLWTTWRAIGGEPAITDPQKAGPDYAIQGEYRGTLQTPEGQATFGAQVIALGDGKFSMVGYHGGLPGEEGCEGEAHVTVDGELKEGAATFDLDHAGVTVSADVMTVSVDGQPFGKLNKVHRTSPTLGAKAPAEAVVLFDGSSADQFVRGKRVEDNLLGATDCRSKQEFKDHSLHLEFRTPFMAHARGQGRGNSGVYIQSRYELQILDSFGLEEKDNECAGIYSIAAPKVNMCFPPLAWQTYDIDFTAARFDDQGNKTQNAHVTVRHNGVVVHDNLELPHDSPGQKKEGPEAAPLFLQNHGNPVVFRNIWVVPKLP
jgi:hypothetical protein